MTDSASPARRRRKPSFLATAVTAACAFLIVLTLLAAQLRAGHDPALGTLAGSRPVTQPAAQVAPVKGHAVSAPVTRSSGG